MSGTGMGTHFGPSAISRAAHLVAAIDKDMKVRASQARMHIRYPTEHWTAGPVTQQSTERADKTDSKFEPVLTAAPTGRMSRTQELSILSALPATVISEIYATEAFVRQDPIDFRHYFGSVDFVFDVRTKGGLSDFRDWTDTLASQAWSVRLVTIKHWTAWWGSGDNKWLSYGDQTQFLRGSSGELKISRALHTLPEDTCKCSMAQVLTQLDSSFDLEQFKEVTHVRDFAHYIRASIHEKPKPTLVDAVSLFVKLLQEHSKHMGKYHGRSGGQCVDCHMPSIYLCGHLSTKNGLGLVFDPAAHVVPESTTVEQVIYTNHDKSRVVDWLNSVDSPGFRRKGLPGTGGPGRKSSAYSEYD